MKRTWYVLFAFGAESKQYTYAVSEQRLLFTFRPAPKRFYEHCARPSPCADGS